MSGSVTGSHNEHFDSLWKCLDLTERRPSGNNQRADRPSQAIVLTGDDEIASSSQGLEGDAGDAGGARGGAEEDTISLHEGRQRSERNVHRQRPDYTYQEYASTIKNATSDHSRKRKRQNTSHPYTDPPNPQTDIQGIIGEAFHKAYEAQIDAEKRALKAELEQQIDSARKEFETKLRDQQRAFDIERRRLTGDAEAFRYKVKNLEKKLLCPVCYQEPHSWEMFVCGHMFCQDCLRKQMELGDGCGACRAPIQGFLRCYPFTGGR